jgi:hypothetical protein
VEGARRAFITMSSQIAQELISMSIYRTIERRISRATPFAIKLVAWTAGVILIAAAALAVAWISLQS